MAKLFTLPVIPRPKSIQRQRKPDPRYVEGQRVLVQAMRYLAQTDPQNNRAAIHLLSEHFRTNFRMSDHPPLE
ncbi:MAG TPA: hypothetical protein VMT05_14380 [Terriglobales bacterium]|jgi:hypothetical protein|nr:hypothetical protein [Terriglobales bacterium]